ncbi:interferon a3-like [Aulostomus maculatus]
MALAEVEAGGLKEERRQSLPVGLCSTATATAIISIAITINMLDRLLLVLASILTPASCCSWLDLRYHELSEESLSLLREMGGKMTNEEIGVSFPSKLYRDVNNSEVALQLLFIRDSLEMISELYENVSSSGVAWVANKTQNFQHVIHRQAQELSQCVSMNKTINIRLRRYFHRLKVALQQKGGSPAAWEMIRSETKTHLQQLHLLVSSILHPSATSRRPGRKSRP